MEIALTFEFNYFFRYLSVLKDLSSQCSRLKKRHAKESLALCAIFVMLGTSDLCYGLVLIRICH